MHMPYFNLSFGRLSISRGMVFSQTDSASINTEILSFSVQQI